MANRILAERGNCIESFIRQQLSDLNIDKKEHLGSSVVKKKSLASVENKENIYSTSKPLFILQVQTKNGDNIDINVREQDSPKKLANEFCNQNQISLKYAQNLAKQIEMSKSHILKQSQSRTKEVCEKQHQQQQPKLPTQSWIQPSPQQEPAHHSNQSNQELPQILQEAPTSCERKNTEETQFQQPFSGRKSAKKLKSMIGINDLNNCLQSNNFQRQPDVESSKSSSSQQLQPSRSSSSLLARSQSVQKRSKSILQIDESSSNSKKFSPQFNKKSLQLAKNVPSLIERTRLQSQKKTVDANLGRQQPNGQNLQQQQAQQQLQIKNNKYYRSPSPELNKKSEELAEIRKRQRFKEIFLALDSDRDGMISNKRMALRQLNDNILSLIAPVLLEVYTIQRSVDFIEFYEAMNILFRKLSIHERNKILLADIQIKWQLEKQMNSYSQIQQLKRPSLKNNHNRSQSTCKQSQCLSENGSIGSGRGCSSRSALKYFKPQQKGKEANQNSKRERGGGVDDSPKITLKEYYFRLNQGQPGQGGKLDSEDEGDDGDFRKRQQPSNNTCSSQMSDQQWYQQLSDKEFLMYYMNEYNNILNQSKQYI